jgi:hypothetical protein
VPGLPDTDIQALIKINHTGQFGRIRHGTGVARTQSSSRFSVNIASPSPGIVMAMILPKSKTIKLSQRHKMKRSFSREYPSCRHEVTGQNTGIQNDRVAVKARNKAPAL